MKKPSWKWDVVKISARNLWIAGIGVPKFAILANVVIGICARKKSSCIVLVSGVKWSLLAIRHKTKNWLVTMNASSSKTR